MPQLRLKRLFRGAHRAVLEAFAASLSTPFCVRDPKGRVIFGQACEGEGLPVVFGGANLGEVVAQEPAREELHRFLLLLCESEQEKMSLAQETLSRYKELTLLYEMSDALSRVLSVEEVAQILIETTQSAIRANEVAVFVLDRQDRLRPAVPARLMASESSSSLAANDSAEAATLRAIGQVEQRIIAGGNAECINDLQAIVPGAVGALLCAPLRTGEATVGLVRATHRTHTTWTAGDLKLLTSLASNAASAIRHAMLHAEKIHQLAVRGQLERFVSPFLLDVAVPFGIRGSSEALAVLFCDLQQVLPVGLPADEIIEHLMYYKSLCLAGLLTFNATVHCPQEEMVLAVFHHSQGFPLAAKEAIEAGQALQQGFRGVHPEWVHDSQKSPGFSIVKAAMGEAFELSCFLSNVGRAAQLHSWSDGRLLLDDHTAHAAQLALPMSYFPQVLPPRGEFMMAYEVPA